MSSKPHRAGPAFQSNRNLSCVPRPDAIDATVSPSGRSTQDRFLNVRAHMPIHRSAQFDDGRTLLPLLGDDEAVFRYCKISAPHIDGGHITATFIDCSFADIDWYWGLFNVCLIVRSSFERCTFRGTSFADCILVECKFRDCRFIRDNLGGECSFDGTCWYGCSVDECEGLSKEIMQSAP